MEARLEQHSFQTMARAGDGCSHPTRSSAIDNKIVFMRDGRSSRGKEKDIYYFAFHMVFDLSKRKQTTGKFKPLHRARVWRRYRRQSFRKLDIADIGPEQRQVRVEPVAVVGCHPAAVDR